jgi:hypothetical protein
MQFSLIKEDKINADLRQHALDGIAKLIQMDNDHAFKAKSRWDKKHPEDIKGKASGRIKNDDLFITSRTTKPRWDERPEKWAPDWCEGWFFRPDHSFANAFGITLENRVETIGHHITYENGKVFPDYEKDENGNVKRNKNDKPIIKVLKKYYSIWTQSTAFNFKDGYTIHSYPPELSDKTWGEQLQRNSLSVQVIKALPAIPLDENFSRFSGYVKFRLFERHPDGKKLVEKSIHETTQDGFVRYLITGELS